MSIGETIADLWRTAVWRLIATDRHEYVEEIRVYDIPGGEKELRMTAEVVAASLRLLREVAPVSYETVIRELRAVARARHGKPEGVIVASRAYVAPIDLSAPAPSRILAGRLAMAARAIEERRRGRSWPDSTTAAEAEFARVQRLLLGTTER